MTEIQERRAEGTGRVRVETLVEVCGNEPGIPAFEAEAVDVSARGMHLRTAYLPDNGAPLVCRFEDGGREIVVEGRVAWRREGSRGGEFGVEFTALDSSSVGALRELCDHSQPEDAHEASGAHDESKSEVGSRVRLHIDGLGSPMKARVRESGSQKVQVGSNLEFLKVGRKLEVEDLEAGGRRQAQIDGVSVAIDPQTRVPQLVVQLRFDDLRSEDTTPEPSVLHFGDPKPKAFKIPASAVTTDGPVDALDNDEDDDADAEAFRGKLGEAAANAGEAVQTAGAAVARFSARAATGMGGLFKGAAGKVLELTKRGEAAPVRRTTSPAPNGGRSVEGQRLRPQSQAAASDEAPASPGTTFQQLPRKKLMLGAGGAVLLASVVAAAAMHHGTPAAPPGAQAGLTPAVASVAPPSTGAPLSANPLPTDMAAQGVASANVPLFGPTPMATMEPAPLAPPPGSPEAVEAQEKADAKSAAAPMAAAPADEGFSDESSDDGKSDSSDSKSNKDPEKAEKSGKTDTTPWGKGKLHSPTIYRLRLDGPGGKLQGATLSTGFTVLIPGHKVMEQGSTIAKRDNRISSVHTSNRTEGAEVAFRFRESIPAYRVRLRRDYVEILIGQEGTRDAKDAAKDGKSAKASGKSDGKVAAHAKAHKG